MLREAKTYEEAKKIIIDRAKRMSIENQKYLKRALIRTVLITIATAIVVIVICAANNVLGAAFPLFLCFIWYPFASFVEYLKRIQLKKQIDDILNEKAFEDKTENIIILDANQYVKWHNECISKQHKNNHKFNSEMIWDWYESN